MAWLRRVLAWTARLLIRFGWALVPLALSAALVISGLVHRSVSAAVSLLDRLAASGGSPPASEVYTPLARVLSGVATLHTGLSRVAETIRPPFIGLEAAVSRFDGALVRARSSLA